MMDIQDNEQQLFLEYAKTKDSDIRDKIILNNLYLVDILAKKFINRGVEFDDLKQIGSLALIKAVERFDYNLGIKFVTFASPSIVGELKNYFRDKSRVIKVSRSDIKMNIDIKRAIAELQSDSGKMPTANEIATHLSLDVGDVVRILDGGFNFVSLDSTVNNASLSLYEVIPDDYDSYENIENRDFFERCMNYLNENEKRLIHLRFVERKSQIETAAKMQVSQMFISRLEKKIIEKLKQKTSFDTKDV